MGTKVGRIQSIGRTGSRFVEVYLDSGEKVDIPLPIWDGLRSLYRADQQLIFVERRGRIFSYVQWAGTRDAAETAVESGLIDERELPPADPLDDEPPDWQEMAQRSIVALVQSSKSGDGRTMEWLSRLHGIAVRAPFPELVQAVEQLGNGPDEATQRQGMAGIQAWLQASVEKKEP